MARAIIVIEASLNSSTLDTVEKARALGRPIFVQSFATVTQRVMGNEALLREGFRPIQNRDDLARIAEIVLEGKKAKREKKREDDPRR